jgi:carboxyl-terminal processing protease
MRHLRTRRRRTSAALAALATITITVTTAGAASAAPASGPAASPPPCSLKPPPFPQTKPTTVTTIGQAYSCIFAHYYAGHTLDDRVLLAAAFAGLTQQLDRLGLDQPGATMPALTGNHASDWARFAAVYQRITGTLPARPALRQQVADATMTAMVTALNNNHSYWFKPVWYSGCHHGQCPPYGLGIFPSPDPHMTQDYPGEALPPLYVNYVDRGSPAARHGVRPGDVITAVNGSAPFTDGTISPGVMNLLNQSYPQQQPVRITLRWPVTGATRTITLTPASYNPGPASPWVTSKLLAGHIGYIKMGHLSGFPPFIGSKVLAAISALQKKATLHGVIVDVRGNGGGSPAGIASMVGLFEHGKPWGYGCTLTGKCTAQYPNNDTPLLHLPLAVLTDRNCVSACDQFASAVKDLHLGTLIGTRTSGITGAADQYGVILNDGSSLNLTTKTFLGAGHEIIDAIGVAPGYYIPMTPKDVATGHDPDIIKALAVLAGASQ